MTTTNPSAVPANFEENVRIKAEQISRLARADENAVAALLSANKIKAAAEYLASSLPPDAPDSSVHIGLLRYGNDNPGHYRIALPSMKSLKPAQLLDLHNGGRLPVMPSESFEMINQSDKPFAFETLSETRPFLPPYLQEKSNAQILAMSEQGNYPRFVKIGTQRSPAYFRKADLLAWAKLKWGSVYPTLIEQMILAGYPDETTSTSFFDAKNKKRAKKRVKGNA